MQDNPFESPQAVTEPQPVMAVEGGARLPIASSSRRLCNLILDTVFFYILAMIVGVVLAVLGVLTGEDETDAVPAQLFGIAVVLLYYVPQELMWGRTLAKFITGTRVVDEDGGKPSAKQILGRTLARFIPFEVFSFLGHKPVGWHDKLSGTRVIHQR